MKPEGLEKVRPTEIARIEILVGGTGIYWPLLNVDHSVPGLLDHIFGTSRCIA